MKSKLFISILLMVCMFNFHIKAQNHQPEYTSFESNNATDMVNLLTGDFTYTMPLLYVPSPEGGYSVPLSYHAGIANDQEASWVGLGWSLNCGNISRNVNGYPEDYSGQVVSKTYDNQGGHGYMNMGAFYSNWYDSEMGRGGSVSIMGIIDHSWGGGESTTSIIGVNFNSDGTVDANAEDVAMGLINVAAKLVSAGVIPEFSTAANMIGVVNSASSMYSSVKGLGSLLNSTNLSIGSSDWATKTSRWKLRSGWLGWYLHKDYSYSLSADQDEMAYGTLYFGRTYYENPYGYTVPTIYKNDTQDKIQEETQIYTTHPESQLHPVQDYHFNLGSTDYATTTNPTNIAYDNFNVMGDGVSGNIQPYRLEVGSLATSSFSGNKNQAINPFPYLDYRVNFRYVGDPGNYYDYHKGTDQILPISDVGDQFALEHEWIENHYSLRVYDESLYDTRIEEERYGLYKSNFIGGSYLKNYQVPGGNYIEWVSNKEIVDGDAFAITSFMDFTEGTERDNFRTRFTAEDELVNDGIGGFCITRSDGLTYHYALPVYNIYSKTYTKIFSELSNPTIAVVTDANKHAIDWLLTGITGPDFVDVNSNGVIDQLDWGYWVKFDYEYFSPNYKFRSPRSGYIKSKDNKIQSYTETIIETYYLQSVKTRTNTAFFVKSVREDGFDNDHLNTSLRLDNVFLLTNEDYENIKTNVGYQTLMEYGIGQNTNSSITNNLKVSQIRRIHFNYDYTLCNTALSNPTNGGKLTLNAVDTYYQNDLKLIPGFIFEYNGSNPSYTIDNHDAWGMYRENGSNSVFGRSVIGNGTEWSLTNIITPLGSNIQIEYERDKYTEVSGYNLSTGILNFELDVQNNLLTETNGINLGALFSDDIWITITGSIETCISYDGCVTNMCNTESFEYEGFSEYFSNNIIYLNTNLINHYNLESGGGCEHRKIKGYSVSIDETDIELKGGDIRVSNIKVSDENGNEYITNYKYYDGVCSIEPEFAKSNIDLYDSYKVELYDYPATPVIYSKVEVQNNVVNGNYLTKKVYEFTMPDLSMIDRPDPGLVNTSFEDVSGNTDYLKLYNYIISVNTSQIGSVKSIKEYNTTDLMKETNFNYTSNFNNDQGIYTEGSFLCERTYINDEYSNYSRYFRTTKIYYPHILKSVSTKVNCIESIVTNNEFDFFTGNVIEKTLDNGSGTVIKQKTIPAYTIPRYQGRKSGGIVGMGSKGIYKNNKNMLTQPAVTYTYLMDGTGTNELGIINAGIQTWKGLLGYRGIADGETFYSNLSWENFDPVWRKHKTVRWSGDLNSDGLYDNPTIVDENNTTAWNFFSYHPMLEYATVYT